MTMCIYGVHIRCAHTMCTYGVHIRCAHTMCTYDVHIRCAHTVCIYGVHIQSAYTLCTYGVHIRCVQCAYTVLAKPTHNRREDASTEHTGGSAELMYHLIVVIELHVVCASKLIRASPPAFAGISGKPFSVGIPLCETSL